MKKDTIRAILLEPGEDPREVEVDPAIESLREIVAGEVEATCPFGDRPEIVAITNAYAILEYLPPNRWIKNANGECWNGLAGNVLFCAADEDGDLADLTFRELDPAWLEERLPRFQ